MFANCFMCNIKYAAAENMKRGGHVVLRNVVLIKTRLICNKEVLKKNSIYCIYLGETRKLTSVKSRPNWDLAYAASVEALLLFFSLVG